MKIKKKQNRKNNNNEIQPKFKQQIIQFDKKMKK